jgi:hypothetical protein
LAAKTILVYISDLQPMLRGKISQFGLSSRGKISQFGLPNPPNPYRAGATFLIWLAKQGGVEELSICRYEWELSKTNHPTPELESVDLCEYLEILGQDLIVKKGELIELTKKGQEWATKWALFYNVDRESHMAKFDDGMRSGTY